MSTPEGRFKRRIKKLIVRELLPGSWTQELKAGTQGIPDTLIIFGDRWALLEFKESKDAHHQPNQDYYVRLFNSMGFARFIYPENQSQVLADLVKYFRKEG